MGLFDALTNAVAGLQAQAYALENISGNIANSSTTGYKSVETSFQDMLARNKVSVVTSNGSASSELRGTMFMMLLSDGLRLHPGAVVMRDRRVALEEHDLHLDALARGPGQRFGDALLLGFIERDGGADLRHHVLAGGRGQFDEPVDDRGQVVAPARADDERCRRPGDVERPPVEEIGRAHV
mgnify:CR=1 FL=1